MAILDTNTQAVLIQYLDDTYPKTVLQSRPFFDRITKKDMSGLSVKVPLMVGYGGGTGTNFENSLANAQLGGAYHQAFTVEPQVTFGITVLDNLQASFTTGPESAIDAMTDATQGCAETAAQNFENMIFGTGFGNMATISANSNVSGTIYLLTLGSLSEVMKFVPNDIGVTKDTATGTLDTGTFTVIGLNQLGNQIKVDAGSSGWTPTNTHVVGLQGQLVTGSAVSTFPGIFAFCPPIASRTTGALNDTFLGVDRSVGGTATGGWALDGTGKPISEGINTLASMMANFATAKPDCAFANPITCGKVASELKTQVRYDIKSITDADVFFAGVNIATGAGMLELLAESACPQTYVVITKASSWVFGSPGNKGMKPSNIDGNIATPSYDHNKTRYAVQMAGYFYTNQPQATGVLTVSP